jgi:hypothetical protein
MLAVVQAFSLKVNEGSRRGSVTVSDRLWKITMTAIATKSTITPFIRMGWRMDEGLSWCEICNPGHVFVVYLMYCFAGLSSEPIGTVDVLALEGR